MSLFDVLHWIFGWVINVDVILCAILLLGVFLLYMKKTRSKAVALLKIAGGMLIILVVVPLGPLGLTFLENRFPKVEKIDDDVVGAILLGGSFDRPVSVARGMLSYTPAAGRFLGFVELARAHPRLKLVFTGGGVGVKGAESEADIARKLFRDVGMDPTHIVFEDKSKNTVENARLTHDMVQPKPGEKWILVTSALHMPRAVGVFRGAGWTVVPYPVDYHTKGDYEFMPNLSLFKAFFTWHFAVREFVAMTNNYMNGHSSTWIPKPL